MSMFLSKRQARNTKTQTLRLNHEMPQQVAIGLTIHQATRSKKIDNILHGFGISVEYNRILRSEIQMATSVFERMLLNDMVYIPPVIVHGRHVFFAVDNVDFGEDTPDSIRTLHATAMAIYQKCEPEDQELKLNLIGLAQKLSNKELSLSMPELLECPKPGPITFAMIPWAFISTVSKVCHSCAGAAISGGVPTRV